MEGVARLVKRLLLRGGAARAIARLAHFFGFSLAPNANPVGSDRTGNGDLQRELLDDESPSCVVFLCVGADLLPFLSNSLKSLRIHQPVVPVFVFCDEFSAQEYSEVAVRFDANLRLIPRVIEEPDSSYAPFGTPDFNLATNQKWAVISLLLDEGYGLVIYSDVDIVFLNPFVSYIRNCARVFPAGFQSEGQRVFPPPLCTGFMYFTRAWREQLSEIIRFASLTQAVANDQDNLNALIASTPTLLGEIYELPGAVFPNGPLHPLVSSFIALNPPGVSLALFHANFSHGLIAKKKALDDLGLWNP